MHLVIKVSGVSKTETESDVVRLGKQKYFVGLTNYLRFDKSLE